MASPRRIGTEGSKTRAALLDATERLMLDEGYAAVSSRRVAAAAGVKPALVHYYFPTMDDLFLALFRRGAEQSMLRYDTALESDKPLRAMWELSRDPRGTALLMEFTALANHRKAVQAEIVEYGERFRTLQTELMARVLAANGIDPKDMAPDAAVVLMTGLSRILVIEESLGMSAGHRSAVALVERLLKEYEDGGPRQGRQRRWRRS
jgi:AcrR family transcriptional regulator